MSEKSLSSLDEATAGNSDQQSNSLCTPTVVKHEPLMEYVECNQNTSELQQRESKYSHTKVAKIETLDKLEQVTDVDVCTEDDETNCRFRWSAPHVSAGQEWIEDRGNLPITGTVDIHEPNLMSRSLDFEGKTSSFLEPYPPVVVHADRTETISSKNKEAGISLDVLIAQSEKPAWRGSMETDSQLDTCGEVEAPSNGNITTGIQLDTVPLHGHVSGDTETTSNEAMETGIMLNTLSCKVETVAKGNTAVVDSRDLDGGGLGKTIDDHGASSYLNRPRRCLRNRKAAQRGRNNADEPSECSTEGHLRTPVRTPTPKKPYQCSKCEFMSVTEKSLTRHNKTHHPVDLGGTIVDENVSGRNLRDHEAVQLGRNPEDEAYESLLEAHLTTSTRRPTRKKRFKRSRNFMSVAKKSSTRRMESPIGAHKWSSCSGKSVERCNLGAHVRKHAENRSHLCWFCGHTSASRAILAIHLKSHTGDKPHLCSTCGYRSSRRTSLTAHLLTHTGEKPYLCSLCGHMFVSRNNLQRHLKKHNGLKPYACPHCDYKSFEKCTLLGHLSTHSGDGQFKCPFCDFTTDHKRSLTGHMAIHNGEKPSAKSHTGPGFANTTVPDIQLSMHIGGEPHACSICSYSSSRKGDFIRHMRTHSDDKPHKCSLCEYTSIRKSGLVVHMKKGKHLIAGEAKNTEDKPHKCSTCDYSSNFKSDLVRHTRMHTGDNPHKCPFCDYSSIRKYGIVTHLKKHSTIKL